MMKMMEWVRRVKQFCGVSSLNYFVQQENMVYSLDQVGYSLKCVLTASYFSSFNAGEEHAESASSEVSSQSASLATMKAIQSHLHPVIFYICNPHQVHSHRIETLLRVNQEKLANTTISILELYKNYLSKIVPTNITYFHFLREKDLYMHYVIVKYILIVGSSEHRKHSESSSIFVQIGRENKKEIFEYLVDWLSNMVDYRNSAIYFKSETIEFLINNTFILICGLMGGKTNENIFDSFGEKTEERQLTKKKEVFNKLMFISIYILCEVENPSHRDRRRKESYYMISMSICCLRKMLIGKDVPDIDIFIPSYLYVDLIGFIHCPLTYEIIIRVLIAFLNRCYDGEAIHDFPSTSSGWRAEPTKVDQREKGAELNSVHAQHLKVENQSHPLSELEEVVDERINSQSRNVSNSFFVSPLTQLNIWGVINLIIEKYGTYNKAVIESFLTKILPSIKPQSFVRAFCIKIISQLGLDLNNHTINKFYRESKYSYALQKGQFFSVDQITSSFRVLMESIYMNYVQEAIAEREVVLGTRKIVKYLLLQNLGNQNQQSKQQGGNLMSLEGQVLSEDDYSDGMGKSLEGFQANSDEHPDKRVMVTKLMVKKANVCKGNRNQIQINESKRGQELDE